MEADLMPRFAVVDIETSGLSVTRHRILQVATVVVDGEGRFLDEWSSLVRLRWPRRTGPRHVHGIRPRQLRSAPPLAAVLTELAQRVDGAVLCAHNLEFDWSFLERAAHKAGVALRPADQLCTLQMSRRLDPERQLSHRLGDVCARHGIVNDRPHDAAHDARATAAVLPHLLAAHQVRSAADLSALSAELRRRSRPAPQAPERRSR